MKIRIAGTVNDSIVDGPGLRFTVFTQGCPHHCPGCHNPATHDPMGGHDAQTEEIIDRMKKNPLLSGVTLSGGEPLMQPMPCLEIARAAHAAHLNVWIYTGYVWEALLQENIALRHTVEGLSLDTDALYGALDSHSRKMSLMRGV